MVKGYDKKVFQDENTVYSALVLLQMRPFSGWRVSEKIWKMQ